MNYFNFHETISTKAEMVLAYEKDSPTTIVTWHNSCGFTWLVTTKLDRWWPMVWFHHTRSHMRDYMRDFLKAVGNNIKATFPFNPFVVACLWYFNNNMFSVIIPTQVFRSHTWVLFAEVKSRLSYQNFFWKSTTC